jgi:hypothetical protein
MLRHWLDATLGRDSRIFFDVRDIETGESWPYRLAQALAHSKVMVCLWSKQYFSSQWCTAELSHMLARRKITATPFGLRPLILAAVIHDGEELDPSLAEIQRFPLQKYSNPWIGKGSPAAEQLSMELEEFSRHVAHALDRAPDHDPKWLDLATDEFSAIFGARTNQYALPRLGPMIS